MMTIHIKINGREVDRVNVRQLGPASDEEAEDSGGERIYRVWGEGSRTKDLPIGGVRHSRRDGARVLARKALDAMT
jgi:hypothetical protein